jgi:hypothetical protein
LYNATKRTCVFISYQANDKGNDLANETTLGFFNFQTMEKKLAASACKIPADYEIFTLALNIHRGT